MEYKSDLLTRTRNFSVSVINLCNRIPKNIINNKIIDQLARSSFSIGANYREANETDSRKDFVYKIRISRKEAKETVYWLELLLHNNPNYQNEIYNLINESEELLKMFSAMVHRAKMQ